MNAITNPDDFLLALPSFRAARLIGADISELDPAREFSSAKVRFAGTRFKFADEVVGRTGIVTATLTPVFSSSGELFDFVAWAGERAGNWRGEAWALGIGSLRDPGRIQIHETADEWRRYGCRGVFIVDWALAPWRLMGGCYLAEPEAWADIVQRRMTFPKPDVVSIREAAMT